MDEVANSQPPRTIVLVDGDTSADKIGSGSDFDDVPIISHNYGKDFEEIVQYRAVYFRALAKVLAELGKPVENITEFEFASGGQTRVCLHISDVQQASRRMAEVAI